MVICVIYFTFLSFSILRYTSYTASRSDQEYIAQHENGTLPGAGALPVTTYARYIPHSFIDWNNAKSPS